MIPIPAIDPIAAMRFAAILGVLFFGWYLLDAYGDGREAAGERKVLVRINMAIEKVNAEAAKAGELDDKLALLADGVRQKALADARAIPAIASICPATKTQADALNRIK